MRTRVVSLVVAGLLFAAPVVWAAPVVTMQRAPEIAVLPSGPVDAFDLFYSSTPGGEFLNFRLIVETTNGSFIHDPNRGTGPSGLHWDDVTLATGDGPRIDTWTNTVYSSLGFDVPSVVMTTYDAMPPGQTPLPTNKIDWTVFDLNSLDDNDMSDDAGDPGNPEYIAPYHIARILIDSRTIGGIRKPFSLRPRGLIEIQAYDTVTLNAAGTLPKATKFFFDIEGPLSEFPEPSSGLMALLALAGLVQLVRGQRRS